jgi:hypothetical protein
MSPRPDVSEERRNQILEAAVKVFARLGFQQTRMDDTIYAHRIRVLRDSWAR